MATASSQPLNVQLSGATAEFVRTQLSAGRHSSAADVIDDLVQNLGDDIRTADRLDAELLDGLNSGPSIDVTATYWETKRRDFVEWYRGTHGT